MPSTSEHPPVERDEAELRALAEVAVAAVRGDREPRTDDPKTVRRVHAVVDAIRDARRP